jgi:lipoprotein-anchoring transpeptidase ErfK/SrfK
LDAPVIVSSSLGRLVSVTVQEAGVATAPVGLFESGGGSWRLGDALDPGAHYTIQATARSGGATTTVRSSFSTLTTQGRLLSSYTPADGSTVGVGEPIDLNFNTAIPIDRRAELLQRIQVTSTIGTVGAWHWFTADSVHFRTKDYWPAGARVTVTANLKGFDAGNGVWGLGNWSMSFLVGDKHVSVIDDNTHQMQVYNNDQLIDTWPVSMGKAGFNTIDGTLLVLYQTPKVWMDSCATFGGIDCVPGTPNFYADFVYYDTAISNDGYFIHAAPWSVYAQGHYDVSHGCVNLSPDRATAFYSFSRVGDVVVIKNTGNPATASDGQGDWAIDFAQFSNTAGPSQVWTGLVSPASLSGHTL